MNNARRKQIAEAMKILGEIRPLAESLAEELSSIAEDERESADTIAEHFPDGERAEAAERAADAVQEMADEAREIADLLDTIESKSEEATE